MTEIDDLKKLIKEKIKDDKFDVENIPVMIKRCPRCNNMTLEYDDKTKKLICRSCGFEVYINTLR